MNKVKYKFGDNYRNFRPITRAADYPHWSIFVVTRKKISTDYLHWQITRTQKKENRWLTQSSFIVLVDMLSFSVQLINFHTFCLRCFIENDTNCKNLFQEKLTSRDLLSRRNRLKRENTLYLKVVLAKKISMIRRIFALINYAAPRNEHMGIIFSCDLPWSQSFHNSWILLFSSSLSV